TPCPCAPSAPCETPAPCAPPAAPCAPPAAPCAPACSPQAGAVPPADIPPQAKPGETWCRVEVPAKYCTVMEKVVSECGRSDCLWTPPVLDTKTKQVCVCPPCAQEVDIPAVYRTEAYCRVVCPARKETRVDACGCTQVVDIPAQTET